jgi:hypothetical protein
LPKKAPQAFQRTQGNGQRKLQSGSGGAHPIQVMGKKAHAAIHPDKGFKKAIIVE